MEKVISSDTYFSAVQAVLFFAMKIEYSRKNIRFVIVQFSCFVVLGAARMKFVDTGAIRTHYGGTPKDTPSHKNYRLTFDFHNFWAQIILRGEGILIVYCPSIFAVGYG